MAGGYAGIGSWYTSSRVAGRCTTGRTRSWCATGRAGSWCASGWATGSDADTVVFKDFAFLGWLEVSVGINIWSIFDEVFGKWHLQVAICNWTSSIEWNEGFLHPKQAGRYCCKAWFAGLIVEVNLFDRTNFFVVLVINGRTVDIL